MKYWISIILLCIMACLANGKNRKESKEMKKALFHYVANWDQYNLPNPVLVDVLKDILNNIASHKRDKLCPFGIHLCDPKQKGFPEDTAKIYEDDDVVTEYKKHNDIMNDDYDGDYENSILKTTNNKGMSPRHVQILKTSAPITNEMNNMTDDILEVLQLKEQINNKKKAHAIQKLFGAHYKTLKIGKKNATKPIKKFVFESWGPKR